MEFKSMILNKMMKMKILKNYKLKFQLENSELDKEERHNNTDQDLNSKEELLEDLNKAQDLELSAIDLGQELYLEEQCEDHGQEYTENQFEEDGPWQDLLIIVLHQESLSEEERLSEEKR